MKILEFFDRFSIFDISHENFAVFSKFLNFPLCFPENLHIDLENLEVDLEQVSRSPPKLNGL